jgi:hypothetical protein
VISGDLNSDLMSLSNNKLIDMMRLFNFKNVIEKPTRVTNHSRTLLDPIIVRTFGMNFNPNRFIYVIFKFVFPANADVFL